MIKNTFPNKSRNSESLKKKKKKMMAVGKPFNQCAHGQHRFAEGVLQVVLFTILCFQLSVKKQSEVKIFQGIREAFSYENNWNYISHKRSCKFAFIPFLSICRIQKQESSFQLVGHLVSRNISVFCLQRVAHYFKDMPNSIDFYKRILLHVIPTSSIVS